MKPAGRRTVRFPSKTDCHPCRGWVNWWEADTDTTKNGKKRDRRDAKNRLKRLGD